MSRFTAGTAVVDITADDRGLQGAAARVRKTLGSLGRVMARTAAVGGVMFAGASGAAIKLAADAEETASKLDAVFGPAAANVRAELDEFADKAGRSRFALRAMAADLGALIGPMGFTADETGDLSVRLTRLATDLSSFFNIAESDALTALRAGLVGEAEPLRRLGVQLSAAKIEAEAFAAGLATQKNEIEGAVKAQAILNLVLRQTQQAQGDAIRTSDSFTNQMRRLTGTTRDLATEFGQVLLPVATEVLTVLAREVRGSRDELRDAFEAIGDAITNTITTMKLFTATATVELLSIASTASHVGDAIAEAFRFGVANAQEALNQLANNAPGFFRQAGRVAEGFLDSIFGEGSLGQNMLVAGVQGRISGDIGPPGRTDTAFDPDPSERTLQLRRAVQDAEEALQKLVDRLGNEQADQRGGGTNAPERGRQSVDIPDGGAAGGGGAGAAERRAQFQSFRQAFQGIQSAVFGGNIADQQLAAQRKIERNTAQFNPKLDRLGELMSELVRQGQRGEGFTGVFK